jgi:predicted heme/steroid binding protein
MANLIIKHTSSVFKFKGNDGKTYMAEWNPKKYDDPKYKAQVTIWQEGQLIATYRTGQFGNKSNAADLVKQAVAEL